ncbi:type VI secretion system protein ImpG [Roseateles sp. YR242]|uniref:type VI secretion system baseplate subunit TssF n=1 Tax=Roseateles sp. YR242 TaxID=1855305 RepID=UPI0008D2F37D|nr:type VI secretion system baseplate subunit TssF [Roseateles sp. YR242]SEL36038.1 type VI secretion system protein ImpG [Roseateles sp. YR242]
MDPRLLRLYSDELAHLREVGGEFAREFPKIAGRLGMEGTEVADPYVERLLEGFAFLSARVQLKLDAEHPRLISHLLESIYPNFLAPVPSMMVARFSVDTTDPNLGKGYPVPRDSVLQSGLPRGQDTRCEFRTAHDVTLWPLELVNVQYFNHAPDLPVNRLPGAAGYRGGLRLRIRTGGGLPLRQLRMDRLQLYISAPDDVAFRLHELVLGTALGSFVTGEGVDAGNLSAQWRDDTSVRPVGFEADQALLPDTQRVFSGCRLLQEAAAMPRRFLFFDITGLADRLARVDGQEADIVVFFNRADGGLEAMVDAQSLALHCTPAINLFPKRLDRIQLGPGNWEYHVVPDRTRPMDFEVHSLQSVIGYGAGQVGQQTFRPLYATYHELSTEGAGYYAARREPRLLSSRQKEQGPRTAYIGEEVFLSLVDPRHAPYREDIRQLSVSALVTNRDLPTLLPHNGSGGTGGSSGTGGNAGSGPSAWRLDAAGPVLRVDALHGPTRPVSRQPVGDAGWSLVSLLTMQQLPFADEPPAQAASTLRRMLTLYGPPGDAAWQRQVEGVRHVSAKSVVRRLPFSGPLSFGCGTEIDLELDELAFQGHSAYLFGSVLEYYFARHSAINSFTQLRLRSTQRGELRRWPVRISSESAHQDVGAHP